MDEHELVLYQKQNEDEITTVFVLTDEQFKQFADELSKPPQLDEKLQKLMKTLPPWEQPQ